MTPAILAKNPSLSAGYDWLAQGLVAIRPCLYDLVVEVALLVVRGASDLSKCRTGGSAEHKGDWTALGKCLCDGHILLLYVLPLHCASSLPSHKPKFVSPGSLGTLGDGPETSHSSHRSGSS
jgi:hypothetical protein